LATNQTVRNIFLCTFCRVSSSLQQLPTNPKTNHKELNILKERHFPATQQINVQTSANWVQKVNLTKQSSLQMDANAIAQPKHVQNKWPISAT